MFLRVKLGRLDRIIPTICQGITQPGNILTVQWTDESAQVGSTPVEGMEIQGQMLNAGVLYLVRGQIVSSSSGRLPRLRIRTSEHCVGVKLRTQQRYAVRGKLEIIEPGGAVVYAHNSLQKMNISLGGFGTRIADSVTSISQYAGFRLEAYIERDGQADEDYPGLVLQGEAELRHTSPSSQDGQLYAGFCFTELSQTNLGMLQFWLATNSPVLREL